MPAPDSMLEPTWRPSTTREAKMWMHGLLGDTLNGAPKDTGQFRKCTCFFLHGKERCVIWGQANLGLPCKSHEDGTGLQSGEGGPTVGFAGSRFEWDPRGVFDPDCTRSGRLKAGTAPFDQVEAFAINLKVQLTLSESNAGQQVKSCSEGSWPKVVENQTKPGAEISSKDMSPHMQVTRRIVKAMPLHR